MVRFASSRLRSLIAGLSTLFCAVLVSSASANIYGRDPTVPEPPYEPPPDAEQDFAVLKSARRDQFNCLAFSPDGKLLAAGGQGNQVVVWDVATSEVVHTLRHQHYINGNLMGVEAVAFSPDGRVIASAGHEGAIYVWNVSTGENISKISSQKGISALAYSSDGKLLASACEGAASEIKIWSTGTSTESLTISTGMLNWIRHIEFSRDGKWLLATASEGGLKVWDAATLQGAYASTSKSGSLVPATFSRDSKCLFEKLDRGERHIAISVGDWKELTPSVASDPRDSSAWSIALSLDGKCIAWGTVPGLITLCETTTETKPRILYTGDPYGINHLAFSPNGQLLAACTDGLDSVCVWDISKPRSLPKRATRSDQPFKSIRAHSAEIDRVAYSPDGIFLATAARDGTAKLWDLSNDKVLHRITTIGERVCDFAFVNGACLKAAIARDGSLSVISLDTGTTVTSIPPGKSRFEAAAFGENATELATCDRASNVRVFDVSSGKEGTTLKSQIDTSFWARIALSPDGTRLAVGGWGGALEIWDTRLHLALLSENIPGTHTQQNGILQLDFVEGGEVLAVGDGEGPARYYRASDGKLKSTFGSRTLANAFAFSSDAGLIVRNSFYGDVWTSDGQYLKYLRLSRNSSFGADLCHALAVSPDNSTLAAGTATGDLNFFSMSVEKEWRSRKLEVAGFGAAFPTFSPDGKLLAIYSLGQAPHVAILDTESGNVVTNIVDETTTRPRSMVKLAFSRDGKHLYKFDGFGLSLCDVRTGNVEKSLFETTQPCIRPAISPDGRNISFADYHGALHITDVASGSERVAIAGDGHYVPSIAFAPDGVTAAITFSRKPMELWSLTSNRPVSSFTSDTIGVSYIAFSPDGNLIAGATNDDHIKVWKTAGSGLVQTLDQPSWPETIAFSPDGKLIAAGSPHSGARVWNLATGECIRKDGRMIPYLAFSPDGQYLATCGTEQNVLWTLPRN